MSHLVMPRNCRLAHIASIQNILLPIKADQTNPDAFSLVKTDILELQAEIGGDLKRLVISRHGALQGPEERIKDAGAFTMIQ